MNDVALVFKGSGVGRVYIFFFAGGHVGYLKACTMKATCSR